MTKPMHTMQYLLTKEETKMAFDGFDRENCGSKNRSGEGIAIVVVIILLLIAMGIVF